MVTKPAAVRFPAPRPSRFNKANMWRKLFAAELLDQLHGLLLRQERKSDWFVRHTRKLHDEGKPLNICTAGMVGGWTMTRMRRGRSIVRRIQQKLGTSVR